LQNLVGTHCCPTFVRAARMPSTPLTCVRMRCRTLLVHTVVLHSYMQHISRHCCWLHSYVLLVSHQHRRPAFLCVAKARRYALLSYICLRWLSAIYIMELCSYTLQKLTGRHCCPTFLRAVRMQSTPLSCVHTSGKTFCVRMQGLRLDAIYASEMSRCLGRNLAR